MRNCIVLLLVLAAPGFGATVLTSARCLVFGQGPGPTVTGTYSAGCTTSWFNPAPWNPHYAWDREWATISIGLSSVSAEANSSPYSVYEAGHAEAHFSAQYVLTLTGGTNLIDLGSMGLGALVVPCLVAGGYSLDTFARMGFDMITRIQGHSCDGSTARAQPILLNVPMSLPLTLHAEADGCCFVPTGLAQFTGQFEFFGLTGGVLSPLAAATYTLTLNDQLPANLPEPGTFAMLAAGFGLWWMVRRR